MNEMEDFKRPNHPDFMLSSELAKAKFSGLRHNSLTNDAELWVLGNLEAKVSKAEVDLNPLAINQAYERIFALQEIMPDTLDAKLFIADRNRREGD